jgi:RNA polymerase I-specific transcription initiation factor RRN6
MAKASPYDLNYGHFGQAIYSIEHGSWMFDREPVQRGVLRQVGFWRPVIEKGTREIDSNFLEDAIRVNEVRHAAKVLARDNCELFPALEVLPDLALASAAVTSTAATYDPAVGDLLSFGSFTAAEGQSRPARRIVAVPTGEAGNILRLIPLVKQRQGWGRDKSFWLEISSFSDTENAYWADEAGPIQQLCFARSEARSAFLAVRFPTKTILFRPVMHQQRKSASRSRFYNLPASRVEPHPVVSIACDKTGGFSHADVTFNPDYQRQFGIVDRMGNWSVWDIEGGQRGSGYSITAVTAGLIAPESGIEDQEAHTREDGWARILWIGDVNTIIVCNRRRLQLYGLKGGETMPLDTFQPVPDHSPHWILDIRKDPTNSRQLFVLTSSHLFLLAVICQNDAIGNDEVVPGAGVVLSWAHFRGLDDITLQLHVPLLTGEEGMIPARTIS